MNVMNSTLKVDCNIERLTKLDCPILLDGWMDGFDKSVTLWSVCCSPTCLIDID